MVYPIALDPSSIAIESVEEAVDEYSLGVRKVKG